MSLVTFKDLCIDVNDLRTGLDFWSSTLGLDVVPDDPDEENPSEFHLGGPTPRHRVRPCVVPEPKTVKNRVHLDVYAPSGALPGVSRLSEPGEFTWTVMAGPEGDEFCVFERDEVPDYRLYEVAVDVGDAQRTAAWWQQVWGGRQGEDDEGFSWLDRIPGVPFSGFTFDAVPEPKTVKNRIHWDVTLQPGVSVADIVAVGADVLREPDDEIGWTIMADPEGNEFCVFERGQG